MNINSFSFIICIHSLFIFINFIQCNLCPNGFYYNDQKLICDYCESGYYGNSPYLTTPKCSGSCHEGYYCPKGSSSPYEHKCGGSNYYCPLNSKFPNKVYLGYYTTISDNSKTDGLESDIFIEQLTKTEQNVCEPGYYCVYGIRRKCPQGYFGKLSGLSTSSCTGKCPLGYFCPIATSNPIPCPSGYYGNTTGLRDRFCSGLCPRGHYCIQGSINPQRCPAGRFGNETGLTSRSCSKLCENGECLISVCPEGFYCPSGTTNPIPCGDISKYCPPGSSEPKIVEEGYYTISFYNNDHLYRVTQRICEKGHYCMNGIRKQCPPGTYGNEEGLSTPLCSSKCPPGHYCKLGSVTYVQCGSSKLFCPEGSEKPQSVQKGYYSYGGLTSTTSSKEGICPIGKYCIDGVARYCPEGRYYAIKGSIACRNEGVLLNQ